MILNSVPLCLLTEAASIKALSFPRLRLSFTLEGPEKALRIFRLFALAFREKDLSRKELSDLGQLFPEGSFTKGHYRRGVL